MAATEVEEAVQEVETESERVRALAPGRSSCAPATTSGSR